MKKLCKAHHLKHEHKICKTHSSICDLHKSLKKSEDGSSPCPYCVEQSDDHSDCKYCADYDTNQGDDHSDCPYCQDLDSKEPEKDDCPYCQEIPPQENVSLQDHQCNCPNCPQSESSDTDISNPADVQPEHPEDCPECQKMYGEAVENQPGQTGQEPPKTQGHETAQEVLDLLDQEPGTGDVTPTDASKAIDNTEMPQGDAMEENTSTTEHFGDSTKGDVSDEEQKFAGEDQPDMASVLQSGLDDHAQEQKKQQVLDMVGQTLQGFKANKAFLEQAKDQNPGLYQSTIQMLKAMISLCDLLGLKPQMQPAPVTTPPQSPEPAAPQGEAAQDPKTQAELVG